MSDKRIGSVTETFKEGTWALTKVIWKFETISKLLLTKLYAVAEDRSGQDI